MVSRIALWLLLMLTAVVYVDTPLHDSDIVLC